MTPESCANIGTLLWSTSAEGAKSLDPDSFPVLHTPASSEVYGGACLALGPVGEVQHAEGSGHDEDVRYRARPTTADRRGLGCTLCPSSLEHSTSQYRGAPSWPPECRRCAAILPESRDLFETGRATREKEVHPRATPSPSSSSVLGSSLSGDGVRGVIAQRCQKDDGVSPNASIPSWRGVALHLRKAKVSKGLLQGRCGAPLAIVGRRASLGGCHVLGVAGVYRFLADAMVSIVWKLIVAHFAGTPAQARRQPRFARSVPFAAHLRGAAAAPGETHLQTGLGTHTDRRQHTQRGLAGLGTLMGAALGGPAKP